MYARALDRLWKFTWIDLRFFGFRTLGDNERHRGWTTWVCWLAFWLFIPILLFGSIGYATALISNSLAWGFAAFTLFFCLHGLAIWGRLKNATDAIVGDPLQASWISSTLASFALLTACFIGLALVSFASFSAGMSASIFDLSSSKTSLENKTPQAEQPETTPTEVSTEPLPEPEERTTADRFTSDEVQTKNNLPVWWLSGDASMPMVGFDASPIGEDLPWEHSEVCRPVVLVIFARSSSDGSALLNKDLSRKRAETLYSLLHRFIEGCESDQRPELFAVSLGQSEQAWHDGSQRVVKIGRLSQPGTVQSGNFLDRRILSVIGESVGLSIAQYTEAEVCVNHDGLECDWRRVTDAP